MVVIFVFAPVIELAYNIKGLFPHAKTDTKALLPYRKIDEDNLGQEPNDPDKKPDRIGAAREEFKKQKQPKSEGQGTEIGDHDIN